MNIQIESYYDGWTISVNGERFSWNQEDSHDILKEICEKINPEATVEYEECY